MRVLWFSNTPSNYYSGGSGKGYNGGGWISSLEALMRDEVELGIVFLTSSRADEPRVVDGVKYFPVFDPSDNRNGRIKKLFTGFEKADKYLVSKYLEIVNEFKPDVIQVFGSEHSFGLVAQHTNVPVILHVQGIVKPYYEVYLPFCSWMRYVFSSGGGFGGVLHRLYIRSRWRHGVRREAHILRTVSHYLCRTDWDKAEIQKVNPDAKIQWGGEVLRPVFYEAKAWRPSGEKPVFVTTISEPPYKGMDVVLRAGKQLKDSGLDFEWRVFGNVNPAFFEKVTGIACSQSGVTLCGVANAETLAKELQHCSAYVHPSYIDNSPNSVCEAQMLGVPVIAAAVGGVPSLIDDCKTGLLFPAGDASALTSIMSQFLPSSFNAERILSISAAARHEAIRRHDRLAIKKELLTIYSTNGTLFA
ncbi:MAG: glycosyltransferase [Bacteroidales bacterium]|nr:glycosyltransferase [Bacteroidales bacterium]